MVPTTLGVLMTQTVKIFTTGRSQAVRLPLEHRRCRGIQKLARCTASCEAGGVPLALMAMLIAAHAKALEMAAAQVQDAAVFFGMEP